MCLAVTDSKSNPQNAVNGVSPVPNANSLGRTNSMVDEMPCVSTRGENGRTIEGFLYNFRKGGAEVRIVCVCHGSFLTPAEFVKHAGGGDVTNPLRHITVNPSGL
jgi:Tify domain binding domain